MLLKRPLISCSYPPTHTTWPEFYICDIQTLSPVSNFIFHYFPTHRLAGLVSWLSWVCQLHLHHLTHCRLCQMPGASTPASFISHSSHDAFLAPWAPKDSSLVWTSPVSSTNVLNKQAWWKASWGTGSLNRGDWRGGGVKCPRLAGKAAALWERVIPYFSCLPPCPQPLTWCFLAQSRSSVNKF